MSLKWGQTSEYQYPEKRYLITGLIMSAYQKNSVINRRGSTEFQEFNWGLSKSVVDDIDSLLSEHYGLTGAELDFVVNYDLKIRMGSTDDAE
jgi:hypothetical protein